jgi:transposase-like protein
MNTRKLQFQKGLGITDFLDQYGTEEKCEAILAKAKWPHGFICPSCGHTGHCIVHHGNCKIYQCNNCHTQTTLKSNTIFQDTKLPLFKWYYAMYLITQSKNNVSALELQRTLGICYRSAWRMKHKITQVMYEREQRRVLNERIELDDAYLGGEQSGGKAGRGSENKVPFLAAVQTDMNGRPLYAVFSVVNSFTKDELEVWAKQKLQPSSIVVSDGLECFTAVKKAQCYHVQEVVGTSRKSTDMPCFTWVNTILGNLKTAIQGTYHAFNFKKYAKRYLAEAQYRFNRRLNMQSIFIRLIYASVQTSARPESWLRMAES